jgi:hypothetical protein
MGQPRGYTQYLFQHRYFDAMFFGELDCLRVTGIRVADNPHAWVTNQGAFQSPGGFRGAISHDHLAGMLAKANAHASTVMERHPRSPVCGI